MPLAATLAIECRFFRLRFFPLLLALLLLSPAPLAAQAPTTAQARYRYWEADSDSLRRVLDTQRADTARLRTLLHMFDAGGTRSAADYDTLCEPGYAPAVRVTTSRVNGHAHIRVRDNGMGIPAEVRAKIFQPFFTTKPTGEGTGLSLSYDIITKGHGGMLTVESQPGQGSTFVVSLPA